MWQDSNICVFYIHPVSSYYFTKQISSKQASKTIPSPTSWCFGPIWKICSSHLKNIGQSNWIISPRFGVKIKHILSCHHQDHIFPPMPNFSKKSRAPKAQKPQGLQQGKLINFCGNAAPSKQCIDLPWRFWDGDDDFDDNFVDMFVENILKQHKKINKTGGYRITYRYQPILRNSKNFLKPVPFSWYLDRWMIL